MLRPYQNDAGAATLASALQQVNRLLLKMPTGTGKTVLFASFLRILEPWLVRLPPRKGAKMLVIAHREELLTQAQDKIQRANPGLMVAIEQGELRASRYADIVIASIQTLAAMKFRRLHQLMQHHGCPPIVIVDEAHHAAARTYRTALAILGFLPAAEAHENDQDDVNVPAYDDVVVMQDHLAGWDARSPKDRLLVGVTATPNRSDAIGLGCVFQSLAYNYALKQAIEDGWLVPIEPWVIETTSSLDQVRTTAGEFNQKDLALAVNNDARNKLAVAAWFEKAHSLPTIAFSVDVAHAHAIADEFTNNSVRARALSGETPKEERRLILRQFQDRQIDVIANCMILTEGTDLPLTECILHCKPTKSATLYEQMTGRGLRIHPGKTKCVVIDVVDIARRHSLQAAPVLYGLPPGLKTRGESLKKIEEEFERLSEMGVDVEKALEQRHYTLAELKAKATTFDALHIPDMGPLSQIVTLNWIPSGPNIYRLAYPWADGFETICVEPDLIDQFTISVTLRTKDNQTRQRTLAAGLPSAAVALQHAEQFVNAERRGAMKLKDKDAPWRKKPVTQGQLRMLQRLHLPYSGTMTAGDASDRIDMVMNRRR